MVGSQIRPTPCFENGGGVVRSERKEKALPGFTKDVPPSLVILTVNMLFNRMR